MPPPFAVSPKIQVGDTVAYNPSYIDRQSLRGGGNLSFARGQVTAVHRIDNGVLLADIEWDTAGLSKRVFVKDLIKVQSND